MTLDRYHVKAGKRIRLDDFDPTDTRGLGKTREEREARLAALGQRLDALQDLLYAGHRHKVLVVLQGMDTSGKDGVIRKVFGAVDPLGVRAVGFKAPTAEELDHDYLWRIHRQMPGKGEMVIFNRSHYEDVLVVRVHGWIDADECARRYRQINAFERMLAETGTTVLKFFLHISREEQRQRLQERVDVPEKNWKFNPGDLAERKLWDEYQRAYEDVLNETSTEHAPWWVVPADSKSGRNELICTVLVDALEKLKMRYPEPEPPIKGIVVE